MLQATKYSATGDKIGTVELSDKVFAAEAKNPDALLYEVINMYLANQRQGTSSVKFRSEVRGSTRKLYRQKGTGSARVGSRRTVVRVGGGRAFGPKPKDWSRHIPKKKKRLALKLALTGCAKEGRISVIQNLSYDAPNTKKATELLNKICPEAGRKLVLMDGSNPTIVKSFSNIEKVKTNRADSTFAYEVLNCKHLVITEDALKKVEEVFGK